MRMRVHRRCLLLACLGTLIPATGPARAQEPAQPPPPPAPPPAAQPGTAPSLEFLEFLGEFETGDGQWHDPIEKIEGLEPPQPPVEPPK